MSKFGICILLSLFTLLYSFPNANAQKANNYVDTVMLINGPKVIKSPMKKRKIEVSFDARQTAVGSQGAKLGGLRIGLEYRRIHRFGIGVFGFSEGVYLPELPSIDTSITDAVLNLNYASIYYERVLFLSRKWEWFSTIHLGSGVVSGFYRTLNDEKWYPLRQTPVKPLEISSCVYYNINWWVSIGGGVGYRYMRKTPAEARAIYNAPVAILRLRVQLFKLIRGQFNPEIKELY
jgi:hypothetical protein